MSTSAASGSPADPEFELFDRYPLTLNDPAVTDRVAAIASAREHFTASLEKVQTSGEDRMLRNVLPLALALICSATDASSAQQRRLSVYISADMEGVAGLSSTEDPLGPKLMTREVNAAIAGAFNAGAALYAANVAETIEAGIAKARTAIESGAAKAKLDQLVKFSQSFAG